jgi:hypothetical protein
MSKRRKWLGAALLATALSLAALGAGAQTLAPGIDGIRPGIYAYGDLWQLAFWHGGQSAGQMSSHDEQGRNIDLGHFHGTYKGGQVLARVEGAGVMYRVWSAQPTGTLAIYVDGAEAPAVECDFLAYTQGACGSSPDWAVGQYANYNPIPFRGSLIVTARNFRLDGAYYQVSYLRFAPDLEVTGLSAGSAADATALEAAHKFWESSGRQPARDPGGEAASVADTLTLAPGGEAELAVSGAGIITELALADAADPLAVLDDVRLTISWDGAAEAAVDSPVDALLGNRFDARRASRTTAGSGVAGYETLIASAGADGYSLRWPMPFSRGARLVLKNTGTAGHSIKAAISYRKLAGLPDNAMRLHALYREQDWLDDLLRKDRIYGLNYVVDQSTNYVLLDRKGRGYYVGCFLYVASLGSDWWGEGDEMIWVDGNSEPAIAGTGTEDDFNWSYGLKENRSAVSGALRVTRRKKEDGQEKVGYNALYRYRPGDFVPFTSGIKVTTEHLGSTSDVLPKFPGSPVNVSTERGDDFRSVAFWYELP